MITYKAVVISSNKRKDGTYPVKIRVTFKCKSRRLPTSLVCTAQDLTRSIHIKNAEILRKADLIIREMREVADTLSPFTLEGWDVDQLVGYIKKTIAARNTRNEFRLDFYTFAEELAQIKGKSTMLSYQYAVKIFRRFREGKPTDINEISRKMLYDFMDYCNTDGKHRNGCKVEAKGVRYIGTLSTIFSAARRKYNDEDEDIILIPRNPFENIERPKITHCGQKSLGVSGIQALIDKEGEQMRKSHRFALDCFLFSFCTMGANAVDIYHHLPPVDAKWWTYNRSKTCGRREDKAEMRVRLLGPAVHYLSRICEYGLPTTKSQAPNAFSSNLSQLLRQYLSLENMDSFSFYAARHSWASIARSIGIEKATIDECLAHIGDYKVADIYAERNWDLINEANTKVLALFDWNALSL